jgi:hypothetical protein
VRNKLRRCTVSCGSTIQAIYFQSHGFRHIPTRKLLN